MFVTLMTTAIIVSLDSFVAGFSLSLSKRTNLTLPAAVSLITLLLCLLTSALGTLLGRLLGKNVDYFGAAVLALLAVMSLVRRDENKTSLTSVGVLESLMIGVAVGMDAAVANLSLAASGMQLVAPLVFGVTHFFTVLMGELLAKRVTLYNTNVFSAVILLVLAVTKLL